MTDVDSIPNAYQESLSVSKPAQNPRSQQHENRYRLSTWCWVRARRLREYTAVRAKALAAKDRSDEETLALLAEFAEASETIAIRGRALAIRVAQMRTHAMRRRGHYLRHLVRQHPDGPVLIPYFDLSSPELPPWLKDWPLDEDTAEI